MNERIPGVEPLAAPVQSEDEANGMYLQDKNVRAGISLSLSFSLSSGPGGTFLLELLYEKLRFIQSTYSYRPFVSHYLLDYPLLGKRISNIRQFGYEYISENEKCIV